MPRLSPYQGPWTRVQARHLLRRAGFGVPPARVEELAAMGRERAVESLVEGALRAQPPEEPDWIPEAVSPMERRRLREEMDALGEEERRRLQQEFQRENRQAMVKLGLWWLKRMHDAGEGVLREKMALFWHGHFAVSAEKVQQAALNFDLNQRLRLYGLGRFEAIVQQVARSPAMLRYLDNDRNLKNKPNENFARELMELFTLGIGSYTEEDIKQAARAFTGWSSDGKAFTIRQRQHDNGYKVFLGERGAFDGGDIIRILMKRREVAPFISRKIWEFFAYENPDAELSAELAGRFGAMSMDAASFLAVIFNSEEFYSPRAVWTQIKSPIHFMVALHGHLETSTPVARQVIQALRLLGQVPFYPPNVKGWDHGRAWINSNTLLLRANIANYLVSGVMPEFNDRPRGPAQRQRREEMMASMSDEPHMMDGGAFDDEDGDEPVEPTARQVRPPLNLSALLEKMGPIGGPADLVDKAIDRFIGYPVSPDQRANLIGMVKGVRGLDRPAWLSRDDAAKVRGMLHLLLSAAEYQLC